MNNFYFTYGLSDDFPFHDGWTRVVAKDIDAACAAFRKRHPDADPKHPCLNCSFVYTEKQFKNTLMYKDGNFGEKEHEVIDASNDDKYAVYLHGFAVRDAQYAKTYMPEADDGDNWVDYKDARIFVTIVVASSEREAIELGAKFAETDAQNIGVLKLANE